jgi:hypothetical protein
MPGRAGPDDPRARRQDLVGGALEEGRQQRAHAERGGDLRLRHVVRSQVRQVLRVALGRVAKGRSHRRI